jgi:hypothetical protein
MHDFSQKEPKTQNFLKKYFIPQNERAKYTPPRQAPSTYYECQAEYSGSFNRQWLYARHYLFRQKALTRQFQFLYFSRKLNLKENKKGASSFGSTWDKRG